MDIVLMNSNSSTDNIMNNSSNIIKEEKFYYFYKITNLINSKYYYGVHATYNLNDGYLGSGTLIQKAVKKWGKENFKKEIVKFFRDSKEMLEYEKLIVTQDLVDDPMCYNLALGGGVYKENLVTVVNSSTGEHLKVKKSDPRLETGELVFISEGRVHIYKLLNDGVTINKYVYPNLLDNYLNDGWEKGTPNKGTIWIHKLKDDGEIIRKMVNEENLQEYLDTGWLIGNNIYHVPTSKGKIYIHRITEGKLEKDYVSEDILNTKLEEGWILGCESKGKKRVHRINDQGNNEVKTVTLEEYDEFIKNGWKPGYCDNHDRFATQKGRKKIHKYEADGSLRRTSVKLEELDTFLNNGWTLGGIVITKLDLVLVSMRLETGKVDELYVPSKLVDNYLSLGWRLGRIK